MRYRLLLSLTLCMSIHLFAQQDQMPIHSSTTVPATARFEIVQSTLAGRWLFKLDRQTGIVYQMVHGKEADDLYWEQMSVRDLPLPAASGVHYQMFLSGLSAKFSFTDES